MEPPPKQIGLANHSRRRPAADPPSAPYISSVNSFGGGVNAGNFNQAFVGETRGNGRQPNGGRVHKPPPPPNNLDYDRSRLPKTPTSDPTSSDKRYITLDPALKERDEHHYTALKL